MTTVASPASPAWPVCGGAVASVAMGALPSAGGETPGGRIASGMRTGPDAVLDLARPVEAAFAGAVCAVCTGVTCAGLTCTGVTCAGVTCTGATCAGVTCAGTAFAGAGSAGAGFARTGLAAVSGFGAAGGRCCGTGATVTGMPSGSVSAIFGPGR